MFFKLLWLAVTCHQQHYNATLYATRETFILTVTEILVTKERLECADSGRSYLKIGVGEEGVGLGERWGVRGVEGVLNNQFNDSLKLKLK